MAQWLNRFSALAGQNGTSGHTLDWSSGFTATSGRVLYLIAAAGVTTSTPSGWTLLSSAVANTGLYVFKKTAAGGETSASVTHNASNFPVEWVVYEFPSGTTDVGSPGTGTFAGPTAWAAATGLTGTYTAIGCGDIANANSPSLAPGTGWTEDVDAFSGAATGADTAYLAVMYQDGMTGSTATPSGTLTDGGNGGERITFALSIPAGGTNATATPSLVAPPAVTIGAPTVKTGSTASPSTVSGAVSIGTPTIGTGASARATPATVLGAVSIPTPTVVVPRNATATPARVNAVASVPRPFVIAGAQWSVWDGLHEIQLSLDGEWNGTSIDALTFSEVIA